MSTQVTAFASFVAFIFQVEVSFFTSHFILLLLCPCFVVYIVYQLSFYVFSLLINGLRTLYNLCFLSLKYWISLIKNIFFRFLKKDNFLPHNYFYVLHHFTKKSGCQTIYQTNILIFNRVSFYFISTKKYSIFRLLVAMLRDIAL